MAAKRMLDLFCGSGGAAAGYARDGWEVIGVDIKPQPHYPFKFIQGDVLEMFDWLVDTFGPAAIHASPPCQRFSAMSSCVPGTREKYPDLVEPTRKKLGASGLPYVIENVIGAPLINPVMLCGTSFGKRVRRHRLFEANFEITPMPCKHDGYVMNPHNVEGRKIMMSHFGVPFGQIERAWVRELDLDWMTLKEARQAIPPYFTEYISQQIPVGR